MRKENITCDRCKLPVKGIVYFLAFFSEDAETHVKTFAKTDSAAEICGGCKRLIDKVLAMREKKLAYWTKELERTFKLTYNKKKQQIKKRKKNGK